MNDTQKSLLKGALKSAIAAAAAVVTGLPAIDSEHFNVTTWHGVVHLLAVIGWVVVVAEARFWGQWANSSNGVPK